MTNEQPGSPRENLVIIEPDLSSLSHLEQVEFSLDLPVQLPLSAHPRESTEEGANSGEQVAAA